MGSPTKLAHAMFWWGEAKAGVAFMPPRGIRCDRLAARAARHCCAVASEVEKPIDFWLRKEVAAGSVATT